MRALRRTASAAAAARGAEPKAARGPAAGAARSRRTSAPGRPRPSGSPCVELTRGGHVPARRGGAFPPLLSRVRDRRSRTRACARRLEVAARGRAPRLAGRGGGVAHVARVRRPVRGRSRPRRAPPSRALADEQRSAPAPRPRPPERAGAADARLRALEGARAAGRTTRSSSSPPDAEFADVRRAVRALREDLEAAAGPPARGPISPRARPRSSARLEAAQAALGAPASRLAARRPARERARRVALHRGRASRPRSWTRAGAELLLGAQPERAAEAERQRRARARRAQARERPRGARRLRGGPRGRPARPRDARGGTSRSAARALRTAAR